MENDRCALCFQLLYFSSNCNVLVLILSAVSLAEQCLCVAHGAILQCIECFAGAIELNSLDQPVVVTQAVRCIFDFFPHLPGEGC